MATLARIGERNAGSPAQPHARPRAESRNTRSPVESRSVTAALLGKRKTRSPATTAVMVPHPIEAAAQHTAATAQVALTLSLQERFGVMDKVVVTGGVYVGRMMAEAFVKKGVKVYIAASDSSSNDEMSAIAVTLTSLGPGDCVAIQADLTTEDGNRAFTSEIA